MKLYYTPIRDYVHTVEAVINYCGLRERIEPVATKPFDADTPLAAINPLCKVPTLVLSSGEYISGGPVIYEYLDALHRRPRLHPSSAARRWTVLRQAWMADGLFDTFVSIIVEGWRPLAEQRPDDIARSWTKVVRILDQLEHDVLRYGRLDIAQARTVGALQFLRLKMPETGRAAVGLDPGFDFRRGRPRLAAWLARMETNAIFREPLA